ncbi:MAG: hypothetical protein J7K94_01690 [Dehalococcoidia bacterium]|nr:hypothetical protein [Dehalococcoidia bacterium]
MLGVISKVTLKLGNRPQAREVALIPFPRLEAAIDAVPDILGLEVLPDGLEFMERSIIEIVEKHLGHKLPCGDNAAFLIVIVEAASSDKVYGCFGRLEEVCRRHGAVETLVAQGEHARRELLEAREKFATALKSFAPHGADGRGHSAQRDSALPARLEGDSGAARRAAGGLRACRRRQRAPAPALP